MSQLPPEIRIGAHFTAADLGDFAGLNNVKFNHPALPFEVEGKVFLNSLIGLTSPEISLNKLPPNMSMTFHHTHNLNEEIYIFVKGKGEFQIDDHIFPVREGSVIRVAPEGVRCWRSAPLHAGPVQTM